VAVAVRVAVCVAVCVVVAVEVTTDVGADVTSVGVDADSVGVGLGLLSDVDSWVRVDVNAGDALERVGNDTESDPLGRLGRLLLQPANTNPATANAVAERTAPTCSRRA
jgi:hypothetical protein